MTTPTRTITATTGEVFINLNDLIIKLMIWSDHSMSSHEISALKKVIDMLVQKREKGHAASH